MAAWLKTFREGNPLSPRKSPTDLPAIGGQRIFYEPLSMNSDGSPKLTRHGEPMGKPSQEVGDLIGGYWNGSYEVGEVWVVGGEPEPSELENWAWQTPVELLAVLNPGVSLKDLAIRPKTLARRVRLRLRPDQEALLEAAFGLQDAWIGGCAPAGGPDWINDQMRPRTKNLKRERPPLAPMDSLGREIQKVLEIIRPMYSEEYRFKYDGQCGAASEAYLHLAGGRDAGLKAMRRANTMAPATGGLKDLVALST